MDLNYLFILSTIFYFAHNLILSKWFKKKFNKNEYFLGDKAPSNIQKYLGKSFYLVIMYYILIIIYIISGFNFWGLISNINIINNYIIQITGFVLSLIFLVLMTIARLNLGSSWRMGLDYQTKDKLVKTGFYKFMRNPYFTFLLSFQFSLILILPNAITILAFIQSYLLINLQIIEEENFLEKRYGEEYVMYKNKVERFIPRSY
jgi:protein-S-isoprenylcysteine O-methyltransferase Ste14